jgi:hypothetical protein
MAEPQVLILGKDIYSDYVIKLQDITKEKTFDRMKLTCNTYTLPVLNRDNQFSINNPVSMFNGIDWLYTSIQIINKDEETDWLGSLIRIPRNHITAKANLVSKDSFYQFRDEVIEYESSIWETGAEAFIALCDYVGFTDYDQASYERSYNILNTANCKIKCNFNKSSNVTFQKAVNLIALYSNAFAFLDNNKLYFKVWEYYTGGASFSVTDDDIKDPCIIDEDESSIYNDFQISYYDDAGIPATDSANNNIGLISRNKNGTKTFILRGDNNKQIAFENLTSAVFIGEGKIRRSHKDLAINPKPLSYINFGLFKDFESRLTIDSYFYMTLGKEGWSNKVLEPFKFTTSQVKNNISLLAYEVASA